MQKTVPLACSLQRCATIRDWVTRMLVLASVLSEDGSDGRVREPCCAVGHCWKSYYCWLTTGGSHSVETSVLSISQLCVRNMLHVLFLCVYPREFVSSGLGKPISKDWLSSIVLTNWHPPCKGRGAQFTFRCLVRVSAVVRQCCVSSLFCLCL